MTADELLVALTPFGQVDSGAFALARGHRTGLPIAKGLVEPTAARWKSEAKGPRDSSDRNPAAAFRIRPAPAEWI